MPPTHDNGGARVVVGYDGSEASRCALERAAHDAGPAGHLFVVHSFEAPSSALGEPNATGKLADEQARVQALIERLEVGEAELLTGSAWETELLAGPPAQAILRVAEARDADAIYVGSRGRGRARALLGSVAHDVLHGAHCPVVVIPGRAVARLEAARL